MTCFGAKAEAVKAAEAAYTFCLPELPGRKTAGLVTLRESRVNAATSHVIQYRQRRAFKYSSLLGSRNIQAFNRRHGPLD